MQNVKQEWFQNFRRVIPAVKVESLKARERKRVLGVVKEKSVLPTARPTVQAFLQLADDVGEVRNRALVRFQHVDALDCLPQAAFFLEVQPIPLFVALNEHVEEAEEKLQVLFALSQRERVDGEVSRLLADIEVRPADDRRNRLEAAADIENEGQRCVLLRVLQKEITKIRFPTPRHPENQRVGNLAVMQVEKVGGTVVGFERGQVFRTEMRVRLFAGQDRKEKRQVGVVRVEQIHLAKVHCIVARHSGEIGVELVVAFREQIAICVGEDCSKLAHESIEVCP